MTTGRINQVAREPTDTGSTYDEAMFYHHSSSVHHRVVFHVWYYHGRMRVHVVRELCVCVCVCV